MRKVVSISREELGKPYSMQIRVKTRGKADIDI